MYPFIFKHFFVHTKPEFAHHLAMMVIKGCGIVGVSALVSRFTKPDAALQTEAMGISFPSPFGVAAGFDKNVEAVEGLEALGFGHTEVGTLTALAQPGNPKPRLFRLIPDRALINRMGFNNHGAAKAAEKLRKLRAKKTKAVIGVNIGKSRAVAVADAVSDYEISAAELAPLADYLVVNVSSPNTPGLRGLQELESLRPLLAAVAAQSANTPLLVKIAPDLSNDEIKAIAALVVELDLAGMVLTNTTISRDGLKTDPSYVAEIGAGGLSGSPLRERTLELVSFVRSLLPERFTIVAVGGVTTGKDVKALLDAGAQLVQGYTGFIYQGPFWARQINRELSRLIQDADRDEPAV